MSEKISTIVIVGGGSAGWITASVLAAAHTVNEPNGVKVRVIESPDIPIIGVGEGTWPTMRGTLERIGVSETAFFKECDASFKQGTKFVNWLGEASGDYYYHPFMTPMGYGKGEVGPFWANGEREQSFAASFCVQEALCEKGLAPKQASTPEFAGVVNYGYHLNAGKFSEFLKRHCIGKLGVEFISDNVIGVNSTEKGDIQSVKTQNNNDIAGDLFVDCTGFRALLIGDHFGVRFRDCNDVLFADTALAVQAPYATPDHPVASLTVSTAQEAGWIWDIGLPHRRGVGHVYSSAHTSDSAAEDALNRYLEQSNAPMSDLQVRKLTIRSGHRDVFWKNNCVAVGLSAGFLEPLEASALVLAELSAKMIAEHFPATRNAMNTVSKRFNERFLYKWDRVIDFLKLHYVLSKRDGDFWEDNRDPKTCPDSLNELLTYWRDNYPRHGDFDRVDEVFSSASYQYVLYGMNYNMNTEQYHLSQKAKRFGEEQAAVIARQAREMQTHMPSNRDLLKAVHSVGFRAAQ